MSNESIETIVLNEAQTLILSESDKTIEYAHKELHEKHNIDDLKQVIAYVNHESLVDSIRYGEGFELNASKYVAVKDARVKPDKIKTESFVKLSYKVDKETGAQIEVKTNMIRIVSGYGNKYILNTLSFMQDVYNGEDKESNICMLKSIDSTKDTMMEASVAYDNSTAKKDKSKLAVVAMDAKHAYDEALGTWDTYVKTMPKLNEYISEVGGQTDAFNKKRHSEFQDKCKNRVAIIRTAIKHQSVIEANKQLEELRTKNTSLRALWDKITNE